MKKSWIEFQVEIHSSCSEAAGNFLVEEGSPGLVEVNSRSHHGMERIIAYFPNDSTWRNKRKRIQNYLHSLCEAPVKLRSGVIREKNWADSWKANFRTLHVTPRIVVKPPWEAHQTQNGEVVIEINPGMAFGTGTHPSTQICLAFLEENIPRFSKPPAILDVGTGSGILAIAAKKLGAGKVLAVDIDPVAVKNALSNSKANQVRGIEFQTGTLSVTRRRFDILIANLLPQELQEISPLLPRFLAPGGLLIVSGFLTKQKREIASVFAKNLRVSHTKQAKGWAGFVLVRET